MKWVKTEAAVPTPLTFTCSKSKIVKRCEICSKLTIKTTARFFFESFFKEAFTFS